MSDAMTVREYEAHMRTCVDSEETISYLVDRYRDRLATVPKQKRFVERVPVHVTKAVPVDVSGLGSDRACHDMLTRGSAALLAAIRTHHAGIVAHLAGRRP